MKLAYIALLICFYGLQLTIFNVNFVEIKTKRQFWLMAIPFIPMIIYIIFKIIYSIIQDTKEVINNYKKLEGNKNEKFRVFHYNEHDSSIFQICNSYKEACLFCVSMGLDPNKYIEKIEIKNTI